MIVERINMISVHDSEGDLKALAFLTPAGAYLTMGFGIIVLPQLFENGSRHQFLTMEDELNFLKMEGDLIFF